MDNQHNEQPHATGNGAQRAADAETVTKVSPEGRPADPGLRGCGTAVILAAFAGLMVVGGIVVAVAWSLPAGVATALLGLFLFLVNPAVWASVARAKQREDVLGHRE